MPFARYVPRWDGLPGSPGYSVFHLNGHPSAANAASLAEDIKDLFVAIASLVPTSATIVFPGEMTLHDDAGVLTGTVAVSPKPTDAEMSGLGSFSAPSGARISWETGSIVGGRRMRGRTFLVPLVAGSYDAIGTLLSTSQDTILAAAQALVTNTTTTGHPIAVWSPTTSSVSSVTSANVPDQATVLRSRRD